MGLVYDEQAPAFARKNVPGATFEVGDIRDAQLDPGTYNLVTCNMVFEFLDREGLDQALKNIYGAMKPNATFVYISTHPGRVEGKYGLNPDEEGWFHTGGPWGGEFDNWHRSVPTYLQQTQGAGFVIEEVEELEMPPDIQDQHPEFNAFGAPARLIVVAHKPV